MFEKADIIYSYSRKRAIEDGVLLDISELAKKCGFKWSVAITSTIYSQYVQPSTKLFSQGQTVEGRLWDLLMILRIEARKQNESEILFSVYFQMENNKKQLVKLKAVAGSGDDGEGVITVMMPNED